MKIKTSVFVKSSATNEQCPKPDRPEYAFIGRSNVGKSSLINALTERRDLAKTSSKPGKTQVINHFLINDMWYLVDLPGYGYAKVSQTDRKAWGEMITNYLFKRENLVCTFVLIDSRIEPQKVDLEFMEKLGSNGVPFALIFTKTDKLTATQLQTQLTNYKKTLLETWDELPLTFVTSSVSKQGRLDVLKQIEEWNQLKK
ncbi:ribosome biogenesis GTP-binding protein YihA/YsxC [Runella slithyformis]|uniref:Probable GTP-binding protein EngB n=1 Tax=Runella slithyformis (strain ATCC 29530 / DSM 19594 / LMG 11500 / NCIMB 11436 / LSU 4) TaxID=761193 RepID=A0A7U3ZH54_RUNSL|nr:ribosome biogenesis GTP-binding protein YihA/YsxC [Runella slithyformis]AEI47105.1 GTP-binding protein engB [Runella slithyformis DSM 19594]